MLIKLCGLINHNFINVKILCIISKCFSIQYWNSLIEWIHTTMSDGVFQSVSSYHNSADDDHTYGGDQLQPTSGVGYQSPGYILRHLFSLRVRCPGGVRHGLLLQQAQVSDQTTSATRQRRTRTGKFDVIDLIFFRQYFHMGKNNY